jgi:chromosome segregation ATPase
MTPAEREADLERREANATILASKLEKDRKALDMEISASAAASKAADAINRAFQSDARKKAKALEDEAAQWEAKLARLKGEVGKLAPAAEAAPGRGEAELAAERKALAADRERLTADRAAFDSEAADARARMKTEAQGLAELRNKLASIRLELESGVKVREAEVKKREAYLDGEREKLQAAADSLMRAEARQAEERTKLESQMAAHATKEVMFEERSRQLQERMKNFAKA